MSEHLQLISQALGLPQKYVAVVLKLTEEGATIPFIARYRKEMTGKLDEVQISNIINKNKELVDLEKRKESILTAIDEQGKLTPELRELIIKCEDINKLEDIYLPYKKRKKTRADIAREVGLEPLAKIIMAQNTLDPYKDASKYINGNVATVEEAINGAKDIIAEWINEKIETREYVREFLRKRGCLKSKVVKAKVEVAQNYKDYFDYEESLSRCPSHRFLAVSRGSEEGFLSTSITADFDYLKEKIAQRLIKSKGKCAELIKEALEDSFKRLLLPSIENQVLKEYKAKADLEAISVFSNNLKQLLLAAPLGSKRILALDPGFKTGCKLVVLGNNGEVVTNTTIYPNEPQKRASESEKTILHLIDEHKVEAVAIGNGTASRETKEFVDQCLQGRTGIEVYVVSENGASIYSASEVGREEFPNLDITVRGAISIGRRLMDPLAELVKIDPKSIGVGQYQYDVDQSKLKENLELRVMSVVNSVGIDINTASPHILQYISGLGKTLAQNIIEKRKELSGFSDLQELKTVQRLGAKAYEQCAGFLRVRNGKNPLDNTGVHPERYGIVSKMAKDIGIQINELINDSEKIKGIDFLKYVSDNLGEPTLMDIKKELLKPGHDPRGSAKAFSFDENIKKINDLIPGMILPGIVGNMTNFGAFIDIGIKQNGMLHISQISEKFISNPAEVLHLGQHLNVKVMEIDFQRERISLTLKL